MKRFEQPNPLKNKTVMVVDDGYQVELAKRLSKTFGRVLYFMEWRNNGYPKVEDYYVGQNIEGIESVDNIFDYIYDTDIFIFTHILHGDLQVYLESIGKLVYGARKAEILEIDRSYTKELLTSLGLPVAKYEIVNGTEDLHRYLQKHENNWVKIDAKFRGLFETTHNNKYDLTEHWIDMIEAKLGAVGDTFEFMIDENLDGGIEIGGEFICSNGLWQNKNLYGIEIKNKGYIGRVLERGKAPKVITDITDKLSPIFKAFGYKGNYSDEIRVTKDGKGYLIDPTCRFPTPPGYLMQHMYKNFDEIIYKTAIGMVVEPEYEHEYGVELLMTSRINETNFLPLYIPDEYRDNVYLNHFTMKGKQPFVCKNDGGFVGSVTASADTIEEAIEQAEEIVDSIEGMGLEYDIYSLKRATDEIEKLEELGINFYK